jgi:hypothetical protein
MAESPAHRFGQILGDILEAVVTPVLGEFAKKHELYLDKKGKRTCRAGQKLTWKDLNGNTHDLDFVLERGGTDGKQGMPAAFIEVAWRRYTKHSRAKAQEIQGAVMPLAETYKNVAPFKGAVLAGVFTEGSLQQLRSLGFTLLYIPTETIVKVCAKYGIDATCDEKTPDSVFQKQVDKYDAMTASRKAALAADVLKEHEKEKKKFIDALSEVVSRQIERIIVLPLYGEHLEYKTAIDAITAIEKYDATRGSKAFDRFEIEVRYNNGNEISGKFKDKESAIEFLRLYQPLSATD